MMAPGPNGDCPTGRRSRPVRPDRTISAPGLWLCGNHWLSEWVRRLLGRKRSLLLGQEAGACCGDPAAPDGLALGLPFLLGELFGFFFLGLFFVSLFLFSLAVSRLCFRLVWDIDGRPTQRGDFVRRIVAGR
jgi:hypothetical protein